jgi:branched-chain amino acid transport system substrate-binding protein
MGDFGTKARIRRTRCATAGALAALLLLGVAACGDDDDASGTTDGVTEEIEGATDSTEGAAAADLLGPEDPATGDPVRIGMISDGQSASIDNTSELRAGAAAAEFLNQHRGGIGGRPAELVTCETHSDPAGATDCANQMVEEGVVAVVVNVTAVAESVFEPLNASDLPVFFVQGTGAALLTDADSTFNITNPLGNVFGVPVAVAESEGYDKVAFVVIDVPAAVSAFDRLGPTVLGNAGLDYEVIKVPPGTADMTPQMQQVASSGAQVVHVIGNDAFCISAFQGLAAVAFDGTVTSITACISDATREAVPADVLEGMLISSPIALGAEDEPSFQLYQAVVDAYGSDIDVSDNTAMGGYVAVSAFTAALEGITGDVTSASIIETIKAMPETELPGGAGVTYRCGGSAFSVFPAVCTNQALRTALDAEGRPTTYEVVDYTETLTL